MGYPLPLARKSVWQFLNRTADPRLSMLQKFADALGVPLSELFTNKPKGRKSTK
jgi:transcriptional regulator with XRE-family HTH domain